MKNELGPASTPDRRKGSPWAGLGALLGIAPVAASHRERFTAATGSLLATLAVLGVSHTFLPAGDAPLVVASIAASVLLIFVLPHGPLSQPWNVLGGHFVSAAVGVACARTLGPSMLAAALAVGLAVAAMYYLKCMHPPGAATALTAVVGGEAVRELGFQFLLTPVSINVLTVLTIAVLLNWPFLARRYPAALAKRARPAEPPPIDHADFVYALSQLDGFVDVREEDLLAIYELATGRARRRHLLPDDIRAGRTYSNGAAGEAWSVRAVVDESCSEVPAKDRIVWKGVAGAEVGQSGVMTRAEFARWARHEVVPHGTGWKRIDARGA